MSWTRTAGAATPSWEIGTAPDPPFCRGSYCSQSVHVETGQDRSSEIPRTTLRARLLGGFDLRLGKVPAPLGSARAESLLAYLLLHRDAPQPRQHLAFLLWPDSPETQARTNLRHVLHNLRRSLPDADRFIDVGARTLQWRREARLWLDVAVFEQAVAEDRVQEAVETYAGDLLEGSYDEWLLEERERLRALYVDALERLARRLEERGEWAAAIRHAERLVRHDPLREETYRLLMRLHDASGDRARALRVFHVCATTLQQELDIAPSAATRQAYEELLSGGEEPPAQPRELVSAAGPPLVGRGAERDRLTALWREAEQGIARLVLVSGEPGIGKTRLVDELRSWCVHRGALTAEARAYPAEGGMAYGPVVAWLRSEPIARRLRRLDRVHLTDLARLLPEILVDVPDVPRPEPLPEMDQRRRLFDAVRRAILAAGAPLLLVVDDLQWCDLQTVRFLHYLLRAAPDARMLVAATVRREDIDDRHPVADLIAGLAALDRISEIPLERLSREETGVLAERITARSLTDADIGLLFGDSEGNPLFVVEALRADSQVVGEGMSPRVQTVIGARLAQLSEPARDLVSVAATIGREFTVDVLADAGTCDDQTFVRALDELWRRGLVRAHGPGAYDFSHGKIREAAYLALSPARRRYHHLKIAQALERAHEENLDAVAGQIATHYDRAGAPGNAIDWYETATDAAQRLHAYTDAVRLLERALEVVRELPTGDLRDGVELRLLTALPAPLVSVEGYLSERVADVHERALDLAAKLGVDPEPPLVRSLALATLTRGEFEAARPFGEQLRIRAERDGDDVLWVESAYVLGVSDFWRGRLEEARLEFAGAVARCRPEHRAAHLLRYGQDPEAFCGLRLAYTLWSLGRDDEARTARDAALEIAMRSGHPFTRDSTTAWAALLALDQHDEEQLRRHMNALTSGGDARSKPTRLFAEALAGYLDVVDGRVQEGVRCVQRAFEEAQAGEAAAPGLLAMHVRIVVETCAKAGDARAGLAAADHALEMGGGAELWEPEIRRLRAEFLAALGATPDTVEAELERALEVAQRQGARSIHLRIRDSLGRLRAGTL